MTIRWKHLIALAFIAPILGLAVGWSGLMSVRDRPLGRHRLVPSLGDA
jgi:hypothetical protein